MKNPPRQLWPPTVVFFSLQGMTWRKHKVPKIKKILPYEMKFLVPNYSCLQNPWLGGYRPQIPVLSALSPQLNLLTPPSKKIPGYATGYNYCLSPVCLACSAHLVKCLSAACGQRLGRCSFPHDITSTPYRCSPRERWVSSRHTRLVTATHQSVRLTHTQAKCCQARQPR